MKKRIIIIGAGPIGCYTAQLLKLSGFDPILIEEHQEVGRPVHCTGLVGNKVFDDKKPYGISRGSIINTINGATIYFQDKSFTIQRDRVAYVIDREQFDKELSKGLDILYQNKFLGIEKNRLGYTIETDKDNFSADIVIGADGANSLTRNIVNARQEVGSYKGVQFRMKLKVKNKDHVEVFLKKSSFFWIVPEVEEVVRIGTISDNPYNDLLSFIKDKKIDGQILEKFGGMVSIGICEQTVKENIALVGDAACQQKPLTYGGVYFGLKSAQILADCIKNDTLDSYDELWKKELALEIKIDLKVREIYNSLNQLELSNLFGLIKEQKALIEKMGDFDSHSQLLLEIIKTPSFYCQAYKFMPTIFKKLFNI
ncbi:MAG: NAD(P)/FAD-dependent oxidoreductase [Candidatus Omnitrophica bacterium]|nr:NAD(P)/FAD-dependent oxidoreductase [Candidatus Omnitrophota bacterium]